MKFNNDALKAFATVSKFFWSSLTTIVVAAILLGTALSIGWLIRRSLKGFTLLHYDLKQVPYVEKIDLQSVALTVIIIIVFCVIWLLKDVGAHILGLEKSEDGEKSEKDKDSTVLSGEALIESAKEAKKTVTSVSQQKQASVTKKQSQRRKRF